MNESSNVFMFIGSNQSRTDNPKKNTKVSK